MTPAAGPRIVLVGAPGAGKSSVGAELARRWGTDLVDTDATIEAEQQTTVSGIFVERGEAAFRSLEEDAVARALQRDGAVVSLGGGAVLSDRTRARLAGRPVAFLDVTLTTSATRVGLGVSRPLLLGNVRGRLKELLDARRPLYSEVAKVVVATDDLTVEQVADELERRFA